MSTTSTSLMTQALNATSSPVTIVDASQSDYPIIYCNDAFTTLTEYERSEIIGKNCRFLQGEDTDQKEIDRIRSAIKEGEDITVTILNYKKSGNQFWNDLQISPIFDEQGVLTHFMGFQNDISERLEKNTVEIIKKRAELEVDIAALLDEIDAMTKEATQISSERLRTLMIKHRDRARQLLDA